MYRVGLRDAVELPLRLLGVTRPRTAPAEAGIPKRSHQQELLAFFGEAPPA